MELAEYIDFIKLELTGNLLELEIPDETLALCVKRALTEVQRYIDTTRLMTIPFASCIDLKGSNVSSVSRVFRSEGYTSSTTDANDSMMDPTYAQLWMMFTNGGSAYSLSDWVYNFGSYNSLLQIRNTVSTDLLFKEDKQAHKLYINTIDKPTKITIEYVPVYKDVAEIDDAYWTDIILKLSLALSKVVLGRIRTRFTQSNALWAQDGDNLLEEGNSELAALREILRVNAQLTYPLD